MTLRHVAQLMGQYGRQLIPIGDSAHQTEVQTQIPAGQCKCIDATVLAQQNLPGESPVNVGGQVTPLSRSGQQGLPDALHILHNHGVVDVVGIAVQLARNALAQIDKAIDKVSTARGALGAVQNRLETRVNVLTSSSTNITEAQSRIEDADFSVETTKLAKAQILSQAATAMLAQANQSQQGVLSLLR